MFRAISLRYFFVAALIVTQSCATYYQANYSFNEAFERGNLETALEALNHSSSRDYRKSEFLFLVNSGLILSVLGRYEESNEYLEKAFIYGEDFRINYLNEAASYLTNPTITPYRGEDHEHLLLLYYKAMNFLKMGRRQEALVECRRLNIRLQQLSDRYDSEKKYKRDAFIHLLMGIIYEADDDFNNAFIAYRNAYEIYQEDYKELFDAVVPPQLKLDILKTSLLSGLKDEFEYFKEEFEMHDYKYSPSPGGDLVFLWHNGLGPVKAEWSINFIVNRSGNTVTFVNEEFGFSFPFNLGDYDEKDKSGLANLEVFRVAFPKYVERPVFFDNASISIQDTTLQLHPVEDVNKIAKQVLAQRMTLEFSKALLRAALKKVTEYEMRKENKALGSIFGIINALTEKADTRNWQSLPHGIYYCKVPMKLGTNEIRLNLMRGGDQDPEEHEFTYLIEKRGMIFHTFTSFESRFPSYSLY